MRGFGIDASVPTDVATQVAIRAEAAGYGSFWVNGSPHEGALDILEAAAMSTGMDLGVGVFNLMKLSAPEIVDEIKRRDLPEDRLWLGMGSPRRPGALAEVREAVQLLGEETEVRSTTAAVGPKMTALAGEISDAVIFTWFIDRDVERARPILVEAAAEANRSVPSVVSYIRCALLPQAAEGVAKRAEAYGAIPHYQAIFERNGMKAADTVVAGSSREELIPAIEREASVLDHPIIRAIPGEDTVESIAELVEACAP